MQDLREHAHQCRAEARPACRAERELEPVVVEDDGGRHHARHPLTGPERLADEVGLAEHAVQVQVEPGQEVAGAETEARRQHACGSVAVDHREVRRVTCPGRVVVEGREQRDVAAGRVEPVQASRGRR